MVANTACAVKGTVCVESSSLFWPGSRLSVFVLGSVVPTDRIPQGPEDRDPEVIEINNSMGHYSKWTARSHIGIHWRNYQVQPHSLQLEQTLTRATSCIKPTTGTREAN